MKLTHLSRGIWRSFPESQAGTEGTALQPPASNRRLNSPPDWRRARVIIADGTGMACLVLKHINDCPVLHLQHRSGELPPVPDGYQEFIHTAKSPVGDEIEISHPSCLIPCMVAVTFHAFPYTDSRAPAGNRTTAESNDVPGAQAAKGFQLSPLPHGQHHGLK